MSPQPLNMQTILMRIERLEEQNRKLKRIVVGGLLALATLVLTGALSAGGQQGKATAKTIPVPQQEDYICTKDKITLPASLPTSSFPDFNIENLSPIVMVRWDDDSHPEELAFSRIVSRVPILRDKLSLLGCMAESLQVQVNDLRVTTADFGLMRLELSQHIEMATKTLNNHAGLINQIGALAADNDSRIRAMQNGLTAANPELEKFKDALCPVLRTLRMDDTTRMNLGYACGLH